MQAAGSDSPEGGLGGAEFVLRRNCSLSPRALMVVFGSMVGLSFGFGIGFAALGAWLILPFAGVELLALAAAFLIYGAHAADCERVRVEGELLTVEVVDGGSGSRYEFPLRQVRLVREESGPEASWRVRDRLFLAFRGRRVEVGRHLDAHRRAGFERKLRVVLAGAARVM